MDKYDNIDDLIAKKMTGRLSTKEYEILDKWLNDSQSNIEEYEYLNKIWEEKSREPKSANSRVIAQQLWRLAGKDSNSRSSGYYHIGYIKYLKIAAVIAIVIGLSFWSNFQYNRNNKEYPGLAKNSIVKNVSPSGQKTKILLPDGSMVFLNSASYIEYAENFTSEERVVDLAGEAYFEVRKDSLRPFTVRCEGVNTTALGTSFNISAFPDSKSVEIGLITGRVLVNNVELEPGEGATYHKLKKSIKTSTIDINKIVGWKEGILIFDGDDIDTFKLKLERWYGLDDIKVNGKPDKDWLIRGEFKNQYLRQVLDVVSFNKEFTYDLNNKELVINF